MQKIGVNAALKWKGGKMFFFNNCKSSCEVTGQISVSGR
jgi:hypothetical protein